MINKLSCRLRSTKMLSSVHSCPRRQGSCPRTGKGQKDTSCTAAKVYFSYTISNAQTVLSSSHGPLSRQARTSSRVLHSTKSLSVCNWWVDQLCVSSYPSHDILAMWTRTTLPSCHSRDSCRIMQGSHSSSSIRLEI